MGLFDRFRANKAPKIESVDFEAFRAISTEGLDLSKPFVDDYNARSLRYIEFGETNLYPQILNQLYVSSPMHQACCNFKKYTLIGNGYTWEGYDKLSVAQQVQIQQFQAMSGLKKGINQIALSWIKHGRVIALVRFDKKNNKYTHFRLVDPEYIRNSRVDFLTDLPALYFYSRDWAIKRHEVEFKPLAPMNRDEWQVVEIKNEVGGFKSYGMPDWAASANWQVVSADLGLLHKSAIENGIQPSVIFRFPTPLRPDQKEDWERDVKLMGKGAKNYGRAMKLEANGAGLLPEVDVINTTDNHALFEQTSKEQKEEIAISHGINPALMGVRIAGSLGQSEEIEFSARQFKKMWRDSNKQEIEDFVNFIAKQCGIETKFKINETNIIDSISEVKTELSENDKPTVNDALKGLTAKENMDLMRIIRDYSKGKLAEPLARTRLAAYGFDAETINEILTA